MNLIGEQDGESLSRIIFNITLPALIINTFNTIVIDFSLILITIIGIVYGLFMALLGVLLFKNEDRKTRGMLSMLVPSFNIGLFAYPLVEAIWGQEGITYFGMFDVGNSLVVFGVSYIVAGYYSAEGSDLKFTSISSKLLKSVPLLSYIIVFCLAVLDLPLILKTSNCIPCMMPFITSQFMPRVRSDRPEVIPKGSTNLAFLGQFAEIPDDVVFTVEYSVRSAQMAVYSLLKLNKEVTPMNQHQFDVRVLFDSFITSFR